MALFSETANIKQAVQLLNGLPLNRLQNPLLTRIVAKLHLPDEQAFGDEEQGQMQDVFEVTADQLSLVLDTISFLLETAAYHQLAPKAFLKELAGIGLGEEQATAFAKLWAAKGSKLVDRLRDKPFFPRYLKSVHWRLYVQLAEKAAAKMKRPNAHFEFTVAEKDQADRKVRVEFTHDELSGFYDKLELIQEQLDSLS